MSTSMLSLLFVRHAHPISAWSRWASTPLVVVPLWYQRSWTALPIAAWMIINPIITPPVTDDRAFATRAILGEKQWIADPIKRRDIIALNAVGAACLSVAGVAAWRRRHFLAVAIAGSMAVILMTWRSYADLYDPAHPTLDPLEPMAALRREKCQQPPPQADTTATGPAASPDRARVTCRR